MKFLITCSAWLEKITKQEVVKQWWNIELVKDRLIFFSWNINLIPKVNLYSRTWNKVYIVLWEWWNIDNFDKLYNLINKISWDKYIQKDHPIKVKATSIKSTLTSTPAIQKITKKSIIDKYSNNSWKTVFENNLLDEQEILTFLIDDNCYILLNTSWETLYKRWYKTQTWEAPIKESLAAWLILLSNWNFNETFYDFTCWSWTICIEALMIAKNIAPWLNRKFAFEKRNFIPSNLLIEEKEIAKSKIYNNKKYNIYGSDIDETIIKIAKQNAKNAWLENEIIFEKKDLIDYKSLPLSWLLISNPPYWLRLDNYNLDEIYKNIWLILKKNSNLRWWVITSYNNFTNLVTWLKLKNKKLYNWNEMCYFYYK